MNMKIPKKSNRYCSKCKKRTEHKVTNEKGGGKRGVLGKGRRKDWKIEHGYGGFPYPDPQKSSRWGVKQSKKTNLRYKCSVCNKTSFKKAGRRSKRVEMV